MNSTTPYIKATAPASFKADGETINVAFTSGNLGANNVYAKVDGAGFSVPSGEISGSSVAVTAAANEGAAREATLTIYAAASEGGAAVAQATVALKQSAPLSGEEATVTITFADCGWSNSEKVTSYTKDDITLTFAKNGGSSDPAYYTSGSALRLNASNQLTVSGATITKIEFEFASDSYSHFTSAEPGTYVAPTWTGNADSVVFTSDPNKNSSGKNEQTRIVSMTVTYSK